MIDHPSFTVEPWAIREESLDLSVLAQTESVFALSNGHIGLRGNLDEGEPYGLPGTYLNGVYENRPLPYAEAGYGYPESGQTVINVTNGKIIRLLVDDEPFDVRYGTLQRHERVLDLRSGTLDRTVEWRSPAGKAVKVRSTRLVSLTQRAIVAICFEVEAVDPVAVVLQSELVANEGLPGGSNDPRAARGLDDALISEHAVAVDKKGGLIHRTRVSGLRVACSMDHDVNCSEQTQVDAESLADVARVTAATRLEAGQSVQLVKLVAYGWSGIRSRSALEDQVMAALAGAKQLGWDGLLTEQRAFLDGYWDGADVEIDGDVQVQQAVRFGLFHIIQAAARAEQRPIPAKGLTGPGYDGHTFWDSETYVMPVLSYTYPNAASDALRWRLSTLATAEQHARSLGLEGAAFAWRTIAGEECSGYWPAGTAAFHINADIADAVQRYMDATQDEAFEREVAVPLLVATARMWRSLGQHTMDGRFRIDGVTGPDEYSAIADNNVYTNLMAGRNLQAAADVIGRHPDEAHAQHVTPEEAASWRDAAKSIVIPFDDHLGIHQQSEGFTEHAVWDFDSTSPDDYPMLLHFPYFDLYRKQVVKQADLVLAMLLCSEGFTAEQKLRNFDYYEAITVRDSSLSACIQAAIAAEVGHLELAHDYLGEAALMDLRDLERNTRDGLHIASLAGAWTALVMGFAGMRPRDGVLRFSPRLGDGLSRLRFFLRYRGRRLSVEVRADQTVYELLEGEPMTLTHHGEEFVLAVGAKVERPVPRMVRRKSPSQPPGREPAPHHAGSSGTWPSAADTTGEGAA
jgi:alpha,alpha-trehalose phosphorylase